MMTPKIYIRVIFGWMLTGVLMLAFFPTELFALLWILFIIVFLFYSYSQLYKD